MLRGFHLHLFRKEGSKQLGLLLAASGHGSVLPGERKDCILEADILFYSLQGITKSCSLLLDHKVSFLGPPPIFHGSLAGHHHPPAGRLVLVAASCSPFVAELRRVLDLSSNTAMVVKPGLVCTSSGVLPV